MAWRRYFSFRGRISRKEFLYGLLEIHLLALFFGLPLMAVFAGVKSSGASNILTSIFALLLLFFVGLGIWAQCALIVKRAHDRGFTGIPVFGVLAFALFFIANAALETTIEESYFHLIFPNEPDDFMVLQAIFFAFGIYINFLFWSGLKNGSAPDAEDYGPPPPPDEEVGFWTTK